MTCSSQTLTDLSLGLASASQGEGAVWTMSPGQGAGSVSIVHNIFISNMSHFLTSASLILLGRGDVQSFVEF